ncbi:hypothetical protein ARMSODRAFT_957656 [Armillaria solidipes]|uniref:Uncharacterized protein n=1 Tax=Armillaria solidipes TaxID=1076256 RepID=A0A2H3BCP4_9AGAR|nr:hypothetical protein ARMSODRAFT_957656 [Armillaria solidipes]
MRYLQYLLNLKDHHYAHLALTSSRSLYFAGKSSWYGDVLTACERLPFYVRPVPVLADATEIAVYTAEVEKVAETWLLQQLNGTAKLYLIHHRLPSLQVSRCACIGGVLNAQARNRKAEMG